jgi:hypothetical protein
MYTKKYWVDVTERVIATYLEAFLGLMIGSAFVDSGKLNMGAVAAAGIAALPAALSLIKALVASRLGDPASASLVDAPLEDRSDLGA